MILRKNISAACQNSSAEGANYLPHPYQRPSSCFSICRKPILAAFLCCNMTCLGTTYSSLVQQVPEL